MRRILVTLALLAVAWSAPPAAAESASTQPADADPATSEAVAPEWPPHHPCNPHCLAGP